MIIKSIEIKNFRSITELKIPIKAISNKYCNIYLGKNETGKSSILKAISLLNPEYKVDYTNDCNKQAKKKNKSIEITYHLNADQFTDLNKEIKALKLPKDLSDMLEITSIYKRIEITKTERIELIWLFTNLNNDIGGYLIHSPNNIIVSLHDVYSGIEEVNKDTIESLLGQEYQIVNKEAIELYLDKNLSNYINENIPRCIYWEPSKEYLINEDINLAEFAKNPNLSVPLRNIFNISDIYNIKERIDLIKSDYEERAQLKEELSENITRHINSIWPEHHINIKIEIEGMSCVVMVEDKDNTAPKYKMIQRSDGFKQFISILLNLSIEYKSQKKNNLILMDEPEIHLHPSGIKYMRDELLKISERNIVFISSHSTYMVDKLNLDRHYKVSKEKSNTTVKQINPGNPYEEEVIYEALGTSIYEHINPNVIVFEGTIDKDIFDAFNLKFKSDYKPVQVSSISSDGVTKIVQYAKFITGTFVKGFILVDSDIEGVNVKRQVIKDNVSFTNDNVFEINDIYDTQIAATIEDLYPREDIISSILRDFKVPISFTESVPILKQIEIKNKESESKINLKDLKSTLANEIIKGVNTLTKEKAKEKYKILHDFFFELNKKLK